MSSPESPITFAKPYYEPINLNEELFLLPTLQTETCPADVARVGIGENVKNFERQEKHSDCIDDKVSDMALSKKDFSAVQANSSSSA